MRARRHFEEHTQGYVIHTVFNDQSLNLDLAEWVEVDIMVENEFTGSFFGA
jgi:hypothetical protein